MERPLVKVAPPRAVVVAPIVSSSLVASPRNEFPVAPNRARLVEAKDTTPVTESAPPIWMSPDVCMLPSVVVAMPTPNPPAV